MCGGMGETKRNMLHVRIVLAVGVWTNQSHAVLQDEVNSRVSTDGKYTVSLTVDDGQRPRSTAA